MWGLFSFNSQRQIAAPFESFDFQRSPLHRLLGLQDEVAELGGAMHRCYGFV